MKQVKIGHSAYRGENAMVIQKPHQAFSTLIKRGVSIQQSWYAVNAAMNGNYQIVNNKHHNPIEVQQA